MTDLLTLLGFAWAGCAACILLSVFASEGVERIGFDIRRKRK
jgi:hypothetical protein